MREATIAWAVIILMFGVDARAQGVARDQATPTATSWTASPTPDEAPPLGVIVASIGRAIREMPSRETAVSLGIAGALALTALPADRALTRRVSRSRSFDGVFEAGDVLGEAWTHVGGALGTLWLGGITGNRRLRVFGVDLARGQAANAFYTTGLKLAIDRSRPNGGSHSFPSGHASASFTAATVISRNFGLKAGLPAYAVASYVAASRVQQNSHYLSDLIFGAAVGIASARSVTVGRGRQQFIVAPVARPDGVALTFVRAEAGWE